MSGAVFHRSQGFDAASRRAAPESRPLPKGYGLAIGAGVSLAMWAALIAGVARLVA